MHVTTVTLVARVNSRSLNVSCKTWLMLIVTDELPTWIVCISSTALHTVIWHDLHPKSLWFLILLNLYRS